jgi:hypothetical protein
MDRWAYLVKEGMWRGECALDCWDDQGISVIASGAACRDMPPGHFANVKKFWERKRQKIRWIETHGCMAEDHKVDEGVVLREYVKPKGDTDYKDRVYLEIRLDNGDGIHFPKEAFTTAPDGVLEYRY